MLDGNGSVNEDVAADSVCNTCIGFTYYDKAMQDAKSTFHCYGLRGTAYESSAKEIEKGIVIYPSEFESYACVGN